MKKIMILILIITSTLLFSCKKDKINPDVPKSTTDLIVNSEFDWRTSKNIELSIIGEKDVNVLNTIYIKSVNGDTTYYKNIIEMDTDYVITFVVPTIETKIIIRYGTIEKTLDLTSNTLTFNYF